MSNLKLKLVGIIFGIVFILGDKPLFAAQNPDNILSEMIKSSVHRMVMEVQKVKNASEKRRIIGQYLNTMESGLVKMDRNHSLLESDRIVINELRVKFHQSASELNGMEGRAGVQDRDLDSFAVYMQQSWEQAGSNYSGGIYLSTGVLLIIIILLVLLT
jgi:hypothetical protein